METCLLTLIRVFTDTFGLQRVNNEAPLVRVEPRLLRVPPGFHQTRVTKRSSGIRTMLVQQAKTQDREPRSTGHHCPDTSCMFSTGSSAVFPCVNFRAGGAGRAGVMSPDVFWPGSLTEVLFICINPSGFLIELFFMVPILSHLQFCYLPF